MAQDIVLALDDYERRYLTTVDPIETVLGDAYLNKFKRELEIDEILTVRIGSERHRIRIIQTDPFVATVREYDSYFDNRISALETGTPPPDPDPTDPATWNATLDPNKLIADNVVFNYTQLANRGWIIVVDSATVPTNDAVLGVSPPTGFTPGDWPRTNPASSYSASEDWYFYEYDDVAGIVLVQSTTGDDFVTVTPRDTLAPEPITDLVLSAGTDTSTQFKYLFSSTTDNSGAVAGYRLRNVDTDTIFIDPAIPDVLTEISGRTPEETISLWVEAYDASGNSTHPETDATNTASITLTTDTPGAVGIAALSAASYEDEESTHTATAILQRTSGSAGAFQVTLSTKDRLDSLGVPLIAGGVGHEFGTTAQVSTANDTVDLSASSPGWADGQLITYSHDLGSDLIGLTNATSYYVFDTGTDVYSFHTVYADSLTGASPETLTATGAETHLILEGENIGYEKLTNVVYSWVDGVSANQNVVVRLVDRGSLGNNYNNMFQLEIDNGSNTDGATNPVGAIGSIDAALMLVNSSSSGFIGYEQDSVGTIAMECEDSNSTITVDADDATRTWNRITTTRGSEGLYLRPTDSGVTRGTATTIEPNACYVQYPLSITLAGSNAYDLFARMGRISYSASKEVHFTLERPIASIGADDSGGGGQFRVTMTEDHGYLAGDTIELEGTDAHDGTYTITDVPATTTWDAANVAIAAQATAGGVALLTAGTGGDAAMLGMYSESWTTASACQPVLSNWNYTWTHGDASCTDRTFTIPAPGSWVLRMYQNRPLPAMDRICISPTSNSLDPSVLGLPGIIPSEDDNIGPASSTYSTSTTAIDHPENPVDTEIPIPLEVETALNLFPDNGTSDISTSATIFAQFNTDVTNIIIQSMEVKAAGNTIAGIPVVSGVVVTFDRGTTLLENLTEYTVTGSGTCEVAGVLKAISFGTWVFNTVDTVSDPAIIYAKDFNSEPVTGRRLLTQSQLFNLLDCTYAVANNSYLSPDPAGTRGMVLEQYVPPRTNGGLADFRYPQYSAVQSIYLTVDAYCKSPWTFVGENGAKFIFVGSNNPAGTPLSEPGKASTSVTARGTGTTSFPFDVFDMYFYDSSAASRGYGRNEFWCDVPTRQPLNSSEAVAIPKDRWFNIKIQMTMNTSTSVSDGILRGWLDGVLKFERTNMRWTTVESTRHWDWNRTFSFGVGGGSDWLSPNFGMSHYYDNLILSSTPI